MSLNVETLKEIASEVRRRVQLLIGVKEAGRPLGRGAGGDRTKLIDAVAERAVFTKLKKKGLSCVVVSEERGVTRLGDGGDGYLIADALDGTNNALRGIPFYCTSLAVADKPKLSAVHSAVVQDLYRGEVFWASKGGGAFLESKPLSPSKVESLRDALVGVDLNPPIPNRKIGGIMRLLKAARHSRHFGANALELCYVASGRLDAFVEVRGRMRVTDMAASQLIVREAGGLITSETGRSLDAPTSTPQFRLSFLAAGNKNLLNRILSVLHRASETP